MSSAPPASPAEVNRPVSAISKLLRTNLQTYALIFATIAIWIFFSSRTDGNFLSPQNFSNLFRQMVITGFLSVGMVLVIVTGNIDLSVGKLAGFVSVVVAAVQANFLTSAFPDQPMLVAGLSVFTGLAIGLGYGILQGYIIAYLGVTSFIVTLGSMWLLNGLILLVTEGRTIPANQPAFAQIAQGYLPNEVGWLIAVVIIAFLFFSMFRSRQRKRRYNFELSPLALDIAKTTLYAVLTVGYVYIVNQYKGVQAPVLLLGLVVLAVSYMSSNTRFGRYAYAIGGNRQATQFSGVNIRRNIFLIFSTMGLLCGVSGVTLASYVGYGTISAGQGYELDAIAACILGGTSTLGGVGTVFGAMVGALIMVSLTNGLQMTNTPAAFQYVLKGIVLVIAVYADVRIKRSNK
jgi:D-xylose transport system permease protein